MAKKIDQKDVEYAAELARLELTDAEKKKFTAQLESVLEYFDKLSELDLDDLEPIYQVTGQENRMREDEIVNKENRDELLKNAPEEDGGSIKVKSVF